MFNGSVTGMDDVDVELIAPLLVNVRVLPGSSVVVVFAETGTVTFNEVTVEAEI